MLKASKKLLQFLLERHCRDSSEIIYFCENELKKPRHMCFTYLSRFAKRGIIKRYWGYEKDRKIRLYCVEDVDKAAAHL